MKNHYEQTGASAVELAFILPILVMVIFGIFQFGIAYNNWIALTHAAREGARLAAVGKY
ncbi:MAG: pilus assembly protein, partial [Actinobacteria bacterium]|nr:pilus assembly protein [Actinomycetota bacterium]